MPIINTDDTKYTPYTEIQFEINSNAPIGVHLAMCVDQIYYDGFVERAFDGSGPVTKNKIVFLFGFVIDGVQHYQATWDFNFSQSEKSKLIQFIKSWTGKNNIPKGFGTESLLGKFATITITERVSKSTGLPYSNLLNIAPPMDEEKTKTFPSIADFKLHGDRKTSIPATLLSKEPF